MIDSFVEEGLISADHVLEKVGKGAFKDADIIYSQCERYFFTEKKSTYETAKQIALNGTFPGLMPKVIRYGPDYSLERFHRLVGVNELKCTPELSEEIGELAGFMFVKLKQVHMDPFNISRDLDTGELMCIDAMHIRRADIYDAIGAFTTTYVSQSDVYATQTFRDEFLQGFAKTSGFKLSGLRMIDRKIPTYEQNMMYTSMMG